MAKIVRATSALQDAQRAVERCSFSTDLRGSGNGFGSTTGGDFIRWASTWVTPALIDAAHALGQVINVDPHFASFLGEFERTHGANVLPMCPHSDLEEEHEGRPRGTAEEYRRGVAARARYEAKR